MTISRSAQLKLWRTLGRSWRGLLGMWTVLLAAAVLFRWHRSIGSLEETRSRVLLTLLGLTIACWLGSVLAAGLRRYRHTAAAGFAALAVSQACYLVLVWSQWKPYVPLWRAWWIWLVLALGLTHVVWIRLLAAGASRRLERLACGAAVVGLAMLAALGFRPRVLDDLPQAYLIPLGVALAIALIATFVLWVIARRRRPRPGLSRWQKGGLIVAGNVAIFVFGFYSGRVTAPAPGIRDLATSPLTHLTDAQLDAQLQADGVRLKVTMDGIEQLSARAAAFHRSMQAARTTAGRNYYLPAEEDELRAQFMTYLAYRAALLRLVATYAGFESIPDERDRARCFLVGFAAGSTVMDASTRLVARYGQEPAVRRKLNEPDIACGLNAGEFDRIEAAVINQSNWQTFAEMATYFERNRDRWAGASIFADADYQRLGRAIERSIEAVQAHPIDRSARRMEQVFRKVRDDAYTPVYDVQSVISTLIGDTRIVSRPPFISQRQVLQMQSQLQPGDILLERRNWFMSNAFLPGFWPHAALYVGTIEDLQRLGIVFEEKRSYFAREPAVGAHLQEYLKKAHDGHAHTVIESVSEGVIFNSLTESMGADYVAVLRPRLTDAEKARAIVAAFSHVGKPYDFEFDFFSADKLVCTELVYRSYQGMLDFDLVRIMGRDTLPAMELVKKYATEKDRATRQLDFVMFLDAAPSEGRATLADEAAFCASAMRPRGFNE